MDDDRLRDGKASRMSGTLAESRPGLAVAPGELTPGDLAAAAAVLARAYRDTPLSIAVYGRDALRRQHKGERLFSARLAAMTPLPHIAHRDGSIVGVCAMTPPTMVDIPDIVLLKHVYPLIGSRAASRVVRMVSVWRSREPKERHWHLGPVGVEPGRQGMGIGSLMIKCFCDRMDAESEMAWLETDTAENVRLYEKFGFCVVDQADVLGVPNWFMRREPGNSAPRKAGSPRWSQGGT